MATSVHTSSLNLAVSISLQHRLDQHQTVTIMIIAHPVAVSYISLPLIIRIASNST